MKKLALIVTGSLLMGCHGHKDEPVWNTGTVINERYIASTRKQFEAPSQKNSSKYVLTIQGDEGVNYMISVMDDNIHGTKETKNDSIQLDSRVQWKLAEKKCHADSVYYSYFDGVYGRIHAGDIHVLQDDDQ